MQVPAKLEVTSCYIKFMTYKFKVCAESNFETASC